MKVHFDEIEFDPTCQLYIVTASYKEKPFTGTAYFTDENFGTYYEWTYKNGNAHGRWFGINATTQQLINEEFYMDGSKNGTFTDWFENGETESKSIYEMDEWMFTKRWNKNKILIKHFDKKNNADSEYYDTGKIYYDTIFDSPISGFTQTFYNTNGIWLMKNIGADKNKWGGYKNEFHEEELLHYSDILNSTFHNNIISFFIWHLRRTNESIAIDYLMKLLNHQDDTFKAEAIIRLGELKAVKAIPFLETFLKDETRPFRINRFQGMEMSNVYTIAELAQRAIRSISPE